MLVLRALALFGLLVLAGLGIAWLVTRDGKYVRLARKILQVAVVVAVGFGLLYLFERILLFV